jgi:hypothetical protein
MRVTMVFFDSTMVAVDMPRMEKQIQHLGPTTIVFTCTRFVTRQMYSVLIIWYNGSELMYMNSAARCQAMSTPIFSASLPPRTGASTLSTLLMQIHAFSWPKGRLFRIADSR